MDDNEVLFREGDDGHAMYIVRSGRITVTRNVNGTEVEHGRIERGGMFGEMALLESQPRSATATAVGRTELLELNSAQFLLRIRRDPTFAYELMQQLSRRVRKADTRYADLLRSTGVAQAAREDGTE